MRIIPAIDLYAGQCVRLRGGDYATAEVYSTDPPAQAAKFIALGAKYLHVIDLDGAQTGRPKNYHALRGIIAEARAAGVRVQFGGGLRSRTEVERALTMGVNYVILGTAAATQPNFLMEAIRQFPENVMLAMDVLTGQLAINGWQTSAQLSMKELLSAARQNPPYAIIHTDIQRDGKLVGMDARRLAAAAQEAPCPLIAAGGFSSKKDADQLTKIKNILGVIVGRAAYTHPSLLEELLHDYSLKED